MIAATSDSGMAVRLMTAVRQSNRNVSKISTTNPQPMPRAFVRLSMARSMKVAGRKIVASISTSFRPGRSDSIAASTCFVSSRVFACGCFSTINRRPGPSLMMASPMGTGEPMRTSAMSPMRTGAPPLKSTMVRARSSGSPMRETCLMAIR